jgi:hypothetical protein
MITLLVIFGALVIASLAYDSVIDKINYRIISGKIYTLD